MIRVHRLDGKELVVNADLIETLEETPDTVVSLTTGRKLVVREPVDEVIERVVQFQRRRGLGLSPAARPGQPPDEGSVEGRPGPRGAKETATPAEREGHPWTSAR